MKPILLTIAFSVFAGLASADYLKLWEPSMGSQLKGATTATQEGGYWFTYGSPTFTVSPASEMPLKNNISTNDALSVTATGTLGWGAAGFDFYNNGDIDASEKTPYDFGGYTGVCVVLEAASSADVIEIRAKQTDTQNDGTDPAFKGIAKGNSTIYISLNTGFTGSSPYDLSKVTGLELAFKKVGSFSVKELGLTTLSDCSEAGLNTSLTIPTTTAEDDNAFKIWDASYTNQVKNSSESTTPNGGYWFTVAQSGPTIAPAKSADIIATVAENTAMVAQVTWKYLTDAAVAALGFDFFDNGTSANKEAMDLSAYEGVCAVYSASNDRIQLALKHKGAVEDGSDYFVRLGSGNGKVFIPWTDFQQPAGAASTYDKDLTQITGMQFVFAGFSADLAVSELYLGSGCPASVAEAPEASSTTIITTKPSSSSATTPSSSSQANAVLSQTASSELNLHRVSPSHISFFVAAGQMASLELYSPQGERVQTLFNGLSQGNMNVAWNQGALKPGIYWLRLSSGSQVRMKSVVLSH